MPREVTLPFIGILNGDNDRDRDPKDFKIYTKRTDPGEVSDLSDYDPIKELDKFECLAEFRDIYFTYRGTKRYF